MTKLNKVFFSFDRIENWDVEDWLGHTLQTGKSSEVRSYGAEKYQRDCRLPNCYQI